MKPWEETWELLGADMVLDGRGVGLFRFMPGDDEPRARLAACAPELARMLDEHGHRDDCAWLALMRRAGLR